MELFRAKRKGVLDRVDYPSRQRFKDYAKLFMNEGIFCIKGFKELVKIA